MPGLLNDDKSWNDIFSCAGNLLPVKKRSPGINSVITFLLIELNVKVLFFIPVQDFMHNAGQSSTNKWRKPK